MLNQEMSQEFQTTTTLIVGVSKQVEQMRILATRLGKTEHKVLIQGETGVGKEVTALEIHRNGRQDKPFVPVNCSSITDTLFESEMFGHKMGSFTGANEDRVGFFESANDGTIFLDEVGTLSLRSQSKLLRVLQNGIFNPVGDRRQIQVKARVITATNVDLAEAVKRKEFRDDLFHRLHVIPFVVPPLRERVEDVSVLADHFLGKEPKRFTPEALSAMKQYCWPGNVRELEHVVMRAVFFSEDETNIQVEHVLPYLKKEVYENIQVESPITCDVYKENGKYLTFEELKISYLMKVLEYTGGNVPSASKITGVNRYTLYKWVNKFDLKRRSKK